MAVIRCITSTIVVVLDATATNKNTMRSLDRPSAQKEKIMWQPEDVLLIWFVLNVGFLVLFVWGEIRAERYWYEFDQKIRHERESSVLEEP
jgi:hypothetical protein